jgi:hypothetical protein
VGRSERGGGGFGEKKTELCRDWRGASRGRGLRRLRRGDVKRGP